MSETNKIANVKINPPVFFGSTLLIFAICTYAALFPEIANTQFKSLQASIVGNAGWFYVLTVAIILLVVAFLGLSKYGEIKLGPDHAEPDFSYGSWFAMLFSAGMGIGLMFFGVAEPVMHFLAPPVGDAGTVEAAREAMKLTFFHWGLHAWGIYAIVALILAFFSYRHGLPLTLRSALYPIIGDKIYGPIGHAVDIFAVIGTVFGVATSLGYGVLQVNAGLNYLLDVPISETVQIWLIVAITGLATVSVVTGLDAGIRRLSELNLLLAVILLLLVGVLGPTALLMQTFVQNTGAYLSEIVSKTFNLYAYDSSDWLGGWTLLYWGWWMSWSPFVGMFIARISRGRTIREFVMGVLFVPAGFTLLWMTFFGNSAIDMILNQGNEALAVAVQNDVSIALFKFLEQFPASQFLSGVATLMVVVFFVTSSDSGSMVVDMLASGGDDNTPIWQRIFWASSEGIVAVALLLAGGLAALQTATIASALPFSIVLLVACYGLIKALRVEAFKRESLTVTHLAPPENLANVPWQRRLRAMVQFPRRAHVNRFIEEVIVPAFDEVGEELQKQGISFQVQRDEQTGQARLEVFHGEEIDFLYEVRPKAYAQPTFLVTQTKKDGDEVQEEKKYFRAEVHLREGGQNYDVMGWTKDQIINDILGQYEKHMHFLHLVR
jgi:choline/glycine/proline betaine transport protein